MIILEIQKLRREYIDNICQKILSIKGETVNIADISSKASSKIAIELAKNMGGAKCKNPPSGQEAGKLFAEITKEFLQKSFRILEHLRPGDWKFEVERNISEFEQYRHLLLLEKLAERNRDLAISLGTDYLVKPDIVVFRFPLSEKQINNTNKEIMDESEILKSVATYTPLRKINHGDNPVPLLHASISCKWTMRSDRSQNTRTEALNLMRNRKGRTPHITAVTAEPLPTRIASLALGTGDLDCVYHMALYELIEAVKRAENEDQLDMLMMLIEGRRLRDISDLPFDLAI
ncbi:MAG: hypothetical protein L5655_11335 [Thermosediminibacteraceae bacterium]|nr:hypothetical protein [Thermosediminibacteraceae bacterium]